MQGRVVPVVAFLSCVFAGCNGESMVVEGTYVLDVEASPQLAALPEATRKMVSGSVDLRPDLSATLTIAIGGLGQHTEIGSWQEEGGGVAIDLFHKEAKGDYRLVGWKPGVLTFVRDERGKPITHVFRRRRE